jgi:hypothetical protein
MKNDNNKSLTNSPMQRLPATAYYKNAGTHARHLVDMLARCANALDHMLGQLRTMLIEARDARDSNWIMRGKELPSSSDPAIDRLLQLAIDYGMKLALAEGENDWSELHQAICDWYVSRRRLGERQQT